MKTLLVCQDLKTHQERFAVASSVNSLDTSKSVAFISAVNGKTFKEKPLNLQMNSVARPK